MSESDQPYNDIQAQRIMRAFDGKLNKERAVTLLYIMNDLANKTLHQVAKATEDGKIPDVETEARQTADNCVDAAIRVAEEIL